ncbi:MAG: ester cyclase [Ardenticatenaceae bacterium]|nr:ester cyclase [Ardenticatenaceae bacterium]
MTAPLAKELVQKWVDAWLTNNQGQIDEIFALDYTVNGNAVGVAGVKQAVEMFHNALSDISIELIDMISEGDKIAVRWTVRGIHIDNFLGIPPSGKPLTLTGINIYQIADGKIIANHEQTNIPELLLTLRK